MATRDPATGKFVKSESEKDAPSPNGEKAEAVEVVEAEVGMLPLMFPGDFELSKPPKGYTSGFLSASRLTRRQAAAQKALVATLFDNNAKCHTGPLSPRGKAVELATHAYRYLLERFADYWEKEMEMSIMDESLELEYPPECPHWPKDV